MTNRGTIGGAVVALVSASIGLATAFGVHLTPAERDAILAFTTAALVVAPLVGAAFDHGNKQAAARVEAAYVVQPIVKKGSQIPTGEKE